MPWKECRKMDEKLRFVARHLDGESISALCREFGISRVTGHKISAGWATAVRSGWSVSI
jgi:putative transposase